MPVVSSGCRNRQAHNRCNMKDSIRSRLESARERHEEVGALLGDPDTIADQNRFRDLSREYASLEPVTSTFADWEKTNGNLVAARELASDDDPEMRAMGADEIEGLESELEALEEQLRVLLLPQDPNDERDVFLEIRAGTGGDEAALFAGDLLRMYMRYAEKVGWRSEMISERAGEHGGYREVVCRLAGERVFSRLKFESGAHRVQRVPETESQGRVHTSAATVAILPQADAVEGVDIASSDLRIDTFRASGAGGQHVNKTDSAIRLTHLPTGVVVECQDERSQHKNRAKAMALLQARLLDSERSRQDSERSEARRLQVGSGDRSERIRTYNFPQGRLTDHRITLTLYKLDEIMTGALDEVIDPLIAEHQAELLAAFEA